MDHDGCSLITFFKHCREHNCTILVVEDECGYKFGGFCTDPWDCKYRFFGTGSNLLYTFEN